MKTAVIMQPTFLPWLGWFDLLDQSSVMIFLDDVGFSKQSWQQRNRIRAATGLLYLSLPVKTSGRIGQKINEARLDGNVFVDKMIRTIQGNYAKAPFFSRYFSEFCDVMKSSSSSGLLMDMNCELINWLIMELGIDKPIKMASAIGVGGERGEHVALLCRDVGATQYLSPAGAEEYLRKDHAVFEKSGIEVMLHNYEHPDYRQCFAPFVPYASVLDLLMNEGPESMGIIRSGRRASRLLSAKAD